MRLRFDGLWRHPDFMKLWAGQTISLFGTMVTHLALPLTAALTLQATPIQMGILGAAEFAPFLLIGLFAGVWVDRVRRRPILIGADIGRALLLGSIPLGAALGMLRMEYLYVISFLIGILTVCFDVSYQSFLPSLVRREQLVEGNSKLEISRSAAQIAGPGAAGVLIQLLTAPVALVVDSISFLASALFLWRIRAAEPEPARPDQQQNVWRDIGEGLHIVLGNPLLRSLAGCTATWNFFSNLSFAVFVLYVTGELGITPVTLGLVFSVGAPGALIGALIAGRVARRFGLGPAIVGAALLGGFSWATVPLAGGPLPLVMAMLIGGQFLGGMMGVIYNINQVSLRQAITPDRLQGRMNATMRFIVWGTIPIGSLIGGVLGETIGLWPTLVVGAAGEVLAFLWVLLSPVRRLREQPIPAQDAPVVAGSTLAT